MSAEWADPQVGCLLWGGMGRVMAGRGGSDCVGRDKKLQEKLGILTMISILREIFSKTSSFPTKNLNYDFQK